MRSTGVEYDESLVPDGAPDELSQRTADRISSERRADITIGASAPLLVNSKTDAFILNRQVQM